MARRENTYLNLGADKVCVNLRIFDARSCASPYFSHCLAIFTCLLLRRGLDCNNLVTNLALMSGESASATYINSKGKYFRDHWLCYIPMCLCKENNSNRCLGKNFETPGTWEWLILIDFWRTNGEVQVHEFTNVSHKLLEVLDECCDMLIGKNLEAAHDVNNSFDACNCILLRVHS